MEPKGRKKTEMKVSKKNINKTPRDKINRDEGKSINDK